MQQLEELLLREAPDAYVLMDLDGLVLYWNHCAEQIFGYASDEVLGKHLNDFIIPDERRAEEGKFFTDTLTHGHAECESIRRCKDATLLHLSVSNKLLRDADGHPQYVLSCKRDISPAIVQRDANLIAARFHGLLESMPDGIVMMNALGKIVLANSRAGTLFGWDTQALRGNAIEVLMPERFRNSHTQHKAGYFLHSRVRAMGAGLELFGLKRNGQEFPIEISLSPLNVEGEIFVMSAIRDISERKRIEQDLAEKNQELQNAIEVKSRFLSNMSHELRTPLNAIIGFTDILLMKISGPINAEQDEQLQTVLKSAEQLLALINDLLELSHIETEQPVLEREPVLCSEIIDEVASALATSAKKKSLMLIVPVFANEVPIMANRRALNQILINLTGNAIKFTDRGSVTLTLTQVQTDAHVTTNIVVSDTGCGIRHEDQAKLFRPFTQLDASAARKYEGTGLGLHLSQKLATLLGGHIEVDSKEGSGSRFSLCLTEPL